MALTLLSIVTPVSITEPKVCLARESEQRDLVENCVDPKPPYVQLDVAMIIVAARIFLGMEVDADVFRRQETEVGQILKVGRGEVGAGRLEVVILLGREGDVAKLWHDHQRMSGRRSGGLQPYRVSDPLANNRPAVLISCARSGS